MASLSQWLAPTPVSQFVARHLGREPFAQPSNAANVVERCDWSVLDAVLRARPSKVLVVAQSKLIDAPAPRSLPALRALFAQGLGIAVWAPEQVHAGLRALVREFAAEMPGDQRVILFATPGGTHGFGWHYDAEDVFIIQTAGDKEYFLRRNTVSPPPKRGFQADFGDIRRETSPLGACRLLPGDLLYVPRGYWHLARAHADALSLSIGVFPSIGRHECPTHSAEQPHDP